MKSVNKELQENIDATLKRWQDETASVGDGFDILRWARNGWLIRNAKPATPSAT